MQIINQTEDENSGPKKSFEHNLEKEMNRISNPSREIESRSEPLQSRGMGTIIPSDFFEILTRLEVLLRLKLSGHTDTLAEDSNLMDQLYKRGETQKKKNNIERLLINFIQFE